MSEYDIRRTKDHVTLSSRSGRMAVEIVLPEGESKEEEELKFRALQSKVARMVNAYFADPANRR